MNHVISLFLGILLDQIVGDPHALPHPVRLIGWLISFLETLLLRNGTAGLNRDYESERRRGIFLWFTVMLSTAFVTGAVVMTAYKAGRVIGILVEAILTSYVLAARSLCRESMAVSQELRRGDLIGARRALSMIVGRDTNDLSEENVIKAAVETVAENTSDGVIAPLLYTALGGPVLGMMYKAVNTMDSMIGYHNEKYEYFGSFAARADDLFNFFPSRTSAVCMIAGCAVLGVFSGKYDFKNACRVWKRDRRNHKSPNSAQTESVCAGALGLELGGTHLYQGIPVEKPKIGDENRKPDVQDIRRANILMFMTEAVVSVVICLIGILCFLIFRP